MPYFLINIYKERPITINFNRYININKRRRKYLYKYERFGKGKR